MNRRANRKAFTIPEVLAVIAIIAIIISILLPAFKKSKRNVYTTICQTNLHQMHVAFASRKVDSSAGSVQFTDPYAWPRDLAPYTHDSSLFICPEQGLPAGSGNTNHYNPTDDYTTAGTETLYLKVYSGGNYLYDMTLVEGPLCRRVDVTTSDAEIADLWSNHPGHIPRIQGYRDQLPSEGNPYILCFEDLRPNGGDRDYEDVVLEIKEAEEGVHIKFLYDGAGYTFDLMQGNKTIWRDMNNGGQTPPGTSTETHNLLAENPGEGAAVFTAPSGYGMNTAVTELEHGGRNVIFMMDYVRTAARGSGAPEGWDTWNDWTRENGDYFFARHHQKANVIWMDGSTELTIPDEINPAIAAHRNDYWRANP